MTQLQRGSGSGPQAGVVEFEKTRAGLLRVREGFRLADVDPDSTPGFDGRQGRRGPAAAWKTTAVRTPGKTVRRAVPGAQAGPAGAAGDGHRRQGRDRAARDGRGGPAGRADKAFKAPTEEERAHDFLWRVRKGSPGGRHASGVFDRSHYEDVLIHRVHGCAAGRSRAALRGDQRVRSQGRRQRHAHPQGDAAHQQGRAEETVDGAAGPARQVLEIQPGGRRRACLLGRVPARLPAGLDRTSTDAAPWYVVPANKKWYARIAVQQLLIGALAAVDRSGRRQTSTSSGEAALWAKRSARAGRSVRSAVVRRRRRCPCGRRRSRWRAPSSHASHGRPALRRAPKGQGLLEAGVACFQLVHHCHQLLPGLLVAGTRRDWPV